MGDLEFMDFVEWLRVSWKQVLPRAVLKAIVVTAFCVSAGFFIARYAFG